MRIFSKKAYRFSQHSGMERTRTADIEAGAIADMPDWVAETKLFQLALKAGNISLIGAAGNAKLDAVDAIIAEAKEYGISNPGNMSLDQLRKAIAEARQEPSKDLTPASQNSLTDNKGADEKTDEDGDEDEDDENLEPITNKPLAEKSFGEMRTLARSMEMTVPRGTNTDGLRQMLAERGVK